MNGFRRFLSAGGRLAHMSNQFAGPVDLADHDSSIRSITIFFLLAVPATVVVVLVLAIAGVLQQNPSGTATLSRPPLSSSFLR
jgi:hypothetical protein